MDKAFLADLIVALHLAYVVFVIAGLVFVLVGALLGWKWIRRRGFRLTHLICTLIVPIEALAGFICPLTTLENWLRVAANQSPSEASFVGRLVRHMLFYEAPPWVFTISYVVFGMLVLAVWFLIPPRKRKKSPG
jgi:ABC-type multidrug transport system permease subunit